MICAVVLAAGRSERMGAPKLLLPLGDKPVIAHVVDGLLHRPIERVMVVAGSEDKPLREALRGRPVQVVKNSLPNSDMLASVRCGLRALPEQTRGVLVALGDQPGLTPELVRELVAAFRRNESGIVFPVCAGRRGHPLLLSARFVPEVLSQFDGTGLRGLVAAHPEAVLELPVSAASVLEDMDTPADYARQRERFARGLRPARRRPDGQ